MSSLFVPWIVEKTEKIWASQWQSFKLERFLRLILPDGSWASNFVQWSLIVGQYTYHSRGQCRSLAADFTGPWGYLLHHLQIWRCCTKSVASSSKLDFLYYSCSRILKKYLKSKEGCLFNVQFQLIVSEQVIGFLMHLDTAIYLVVCWCSGPWSCTINF